MCTNKSQFLISSMHTNYVQFLSTFLSRWKKYYHLNMMGKLKIHFYEFERELWTRKLLFDAAATAGDWVWRQTVALLSSGKHKLIFNVLCMRLQRSQSVHNPISVFFFYFISLRFTSEARAFRMKRWFCDATHFFLPHFYYSVKFSLFIVLFQ